MYGLTMLWAGRWDAACVALWTFVAFTSWTNAQGRSLPVEDILLVKNEPSPKCLSRMVDGIPKEFTCFFMTEDSDSAPEFYYTIDNPPRRTRCEMQVQRSDDGGFLHICSFPQTDVFLFVDIPLEVLDRAKNRSLYSRTVTVEDNVVQEPPSNISLIQNNNIGELLLSWRAESAFTTLFYKIRFSSKSMNQTIKQVRSKFKETLDGLVPGEEVKVQVSAKCSNSITTGHWSRWSPPVKAVVPQSADDILLTCSTKDLLNVTCQWDSSVSNIEAGYTLFYKTGSSEGRGWTQWTQCFPETNFTDQCGFQGNAQRSMRVKLSSPMAPLNKTFYSEDFKLNTIIKTSPPSLLKQNETDKLCVSWDSPLPALSSHLQYELNYRPTAEKHWTTVASNGPETEVCLKRSWSGQFDVKVRAQPFGPEYSGQWSDWSDVLTADIPVHSSSRNMLLVHCSPVLFLAFAVLLILLFSKYFKKLKLYVWPPVPNLDKVLQDFLTDLKQQKWDGPVTAKQLYGETTASIVVLSEDDDSGLEEASAKSAALLTSSGTSYSSVGQEDDSIDTELYPDYVALNKNTIILCTKENSYIYEDHNKDKAVTIIQKSPRSSKETLTREPCSGSDFLNHSYLFLATENVGSKGREQRGQENIYTNMPCN